MSEHNIKVGNAQYTIKSVEEGENTKYSFTVLNVDYEVNLYEGKYDLYRCPDAICHGAGEGFNDLQQAVEYADIYERMIKYAFDLSSSKDKGIKTLKHIIDNHLSLMDLF